MRERFEFLILFLLCCVFVSPSTHAQEQDPARNDAASGNVSPDTRNDETSTVPTSESPAADAPSLSNEDSTRHPGAMRTVESWQHEQFKRALPHIVKAEGLFENDMFEAAAEEYQRAGEILEGHPKHFQTQYNLGLCYERLFRYSEALKYYKNYLRTAAPRTPNREEVERLIRTLRELLATLQISVNVKAKVWVDGLLIGQAPGALLVAGGRHRIELRAEGFQTEQLEVRVPAQTVRKLTVQMETIGTFQGIDPSYFWVSSALAVTAVGIGAYFGIDSLLEDKKTRDAYRKDALEAEEREYDELDEQLKKDKEKIEDLQITADLFFAIGGGLALGSVVLFFLTEWDSPENSPTVSRFDPSLSFTTRVSRHGVYGNLAGFF